MFSQMLGGIEADPLHHVAAANTSGAGPAPPLATYITAAATGPAIGRQAINAQMDGIIPSLFIETSKAAMGC